MSGPEPGNHAPILPRARPADDALPLVPSRRLDNRSLRRTLRIPMPTTIARCPWADGSAAYAAYHDDEWGVPVHDDRVFFEFLILEGAQAGLSAGRRSSTSATATARRSPASIRRGSRGSMRAAIERLLAQPGRSSATGSRSRARWTTRARSSTSQREFGSFDRYVWAFVGGKPIRNRWRTLADGPGAARRESDALSKDLQAPRLPLRRLDDHVRVHAGDRPRQRPPRRLPALDGRAAGGALTGAASHRCAARAAANPSHPRVKSASARPGSSVDRARPS